MMKPSTPCALLLFLVAAMPALAQSHPHARCLTPLLAERRLAPEKIDPALLAILNQLCSGPSEPGGRPTKQANVLTSGGHFRVHYDTQGENAVAPRDIDGNNVPDFIDSVGFYLEYAWRVEIDEFGYDAPPSDRRGIGPEIDVFICDLPAQFYGGAQTENDNVLSEDPARVHGYLILDNDYAGYPTPGMDGVRVTTAHELHHIIQFAAYRDALEPFSRVSQFALYEATATWLEKKVHPDLHDWRQYADELLRNPQKYGFSTHNTGDFTSGYGHVLYIDYLEKRFGRDVVREIWDDFRTRETFDAIDATLMRRDFNLARSYCEFGEWAYYTGYRARDTALLKEAPGLPAMRPAQTTMLQGSETSFDGELFPLSFGLYRLLLGTSNPNIRDTVDFLVTNSRSNLGMGGPTVDMEQFRIDISTDERPDYLPLARDEATIYYRLVPLAGGSADAFCLDVIDDSVNTIVGIRTSPQPFINKPGEEILFSVDGASDEVLNARLWIYTTAMTRVTEVSQTGLKGRDNQLGVLWNGRDRHGEAVPTGIYIYELSINGKPPVLGKIAVVRE